MGDAGRDLEPRSLGGADLVDDQLALEDVERLDVLAVDVGIVGAGEHGDADLLDVAQHAVAVAERRLRGRPPAVLRRVELVEVAQPAHVVGEALAGGVEVEVAQLGVASVAEAVGDVRRHPGQGPGGRHGLVAVGAELDRQLAGQHVEEVAVPAVDVEVRAGAARPEARPGRVQRVDVGEHLDAPVGRVADDLALARRDDLHRGA